MFVSMTCPGFHSLVSCNGHVMLSCFLVIHQKYDYDSSTVRKKFFREALLQITIPFLLKKLAPTCKGVRRNPCCVVTEEVPIPGMGWS